MKQKLHLITLGVNDLKKSLSFYEGLGWKMSKKSLENLPLFPLGGITLALYSREGLAEDAHVKNTKPGFSGLTLSYNTKSEKEVEEILDKVEKLGGKIVKQAQKAFWGGYNGYFKDLDGHLFEIAYNPFWELDENNNLKL
ncbi:MAG TPA: VOC family protein [Ignavibacteriaceae bacterium]|nr:VOC family protein [Ignavibacteriaceae bacterium]